LLRVSKFCYKSGYVLKSCYELAWSGLPITISASNRFHALSAVNFETFSQSRSIAATVPADRLVDSVSKNGYIGDDVRNWDLMDIKFHNAAEKEIRKLAEGAKSDKELVAIIGGELVARFGQVREGMQ